MLIGGLAAVARGVLRQTGDVRATVWAADLDPERLVAVLARHGIEPRIPDALDFARQHQVLLLRHPPSGTPIELSLAWLPFERAALERATTEDFGGVRVRVATPEDLIVYKAVAWRDRDRADIERLLLLHGGRVDLEAVRAVLREFFDLLGVPERLGELDRIIAGARAEA